MSEIAKETWTKWADAWYRTRVTHDKRTNHEGISKYTEKQLLTAGIWDIWETRWKRPELNNKENLNQIYIQQADFELIEGLEWCNYKSDKITDETPYMCKKGVVFGKPCIIIQEVDHDCILGAKVVTPDIELIIWLEDFQRAPRRRIVNIDKKDVYDINSLEKHGVRFNSTIDKEELDKNGVMITGIDNYDNYWYEIYDSLRNTYQHQKRIDFIEADDKLAMFLERWLDNHELKNSDNDLVEFWDKSLEYKLKWNYVYEHNSPWDRNTYGFDLYEGVMKKLCEEYDVPITIGWDMWKILTSEKMKEVLTSINQRYAIFNNEKQVIEEKHEIIATSGSALLFRDDGVIIFKHKGSL